MNEPAANTSPDALFLLGTHCPHCPGMLQSLANLVKAGTLGTLRVVNIEQRIDIARELGVRSVPWVRIGSFELEGLHSEQELREWALKAGTDSGMTDWLNDLLSSGNISKPLERVRSDPETMDALLELFTDPDTQLNTRIGISAIMEDLEGTDTLRATVDRLGKLTHHEDARIRGDACHYLALAGTPEANDYIRPLLDDPDSGVREVAQESLE
ncbi:MAG: HEAT repeat domain-containing protein [Gammaproteobacteria bacterium]